jgi:hypothetical protein
VHWAPSMKNLHTRAPSLALLSLADVAGGASRGSYQSQGSPPSHSSYERWVTQKEALPHVGSGTGMVRSGINKYPPTASKDTKPDPKSGWTNPGESSLRHEYKR